jgi:hypothetical protein
MHDHRRVTASIRLQPISRHHSPDSFERLSRFVVRDLEVRQISNVPVRQDAEHVLTREESDRLAGLLEHVIRLQLTLHRSSQRAEGSVVVGVHVEEKQPRWSDDAPDFTEIDRVTWSLNMCTDTFAIKASKA